VTVKASLSLPTQCSGQARFRNFLTTKSLCGGSDVLEDKRRLQFLKFVPETIRALQDKFSYSKQTVLTNNPQNFYFLASTKHAQQMNMDDSISWSTSCGHWLPYFYVLMSRHTPEYDQEFCLLNNNNNNNNNNICVSNTPGNHEFKELQKTAILGTAHILRKVLT